MRQVVFICAKEEEEDEVQKEEIYVLKHTHMQSQVIHNTIPLLFKCHSFRTVSARECMYLPQCRIHHMEIRNKNRFSWELKHSNGNNWLNQIDSIILLSLENKIYLRETKLFHFVCSRNRLVVNRKKCKFQNQTNWNRNIDMFASAAPSFVHFRFVWKHRGFVHFKKFNVQFSNDAYVSRETNIFDNKFSFS